MRILFGLLAVLAVEFISVHANATLTISPENGGSLASPTPLTQGTFSLYYFVSTGTTPSFPFAFLPSGSKVLDISKGQSEGSLTNAISVRISSTALIGTAGLGGQQNVIVIQVGSRNVPIAGVNGTACSNLTCQGYNQNNTVNTAGGVNVAPYYAGKVSGNSFTVQFYPTDICADVNASGGLVTLQGCSGSAVTVPTDSANTVFPLKFLIQTTPNAQPEALPTGNVDSSVTAVNFTFQTKPSSFQCPDLGAVTILPDDQRIYIDASKFSISGPSNFAPGYKLIVVGQDQGSATTVVKAPDLTVNFSGANDVVTIGDFGLVNYFATGTGDKKFINTGSTIHNYQLGFMVQDAAGVYAIPSPIPTGTAPSCYAYGPIGTSDVRGFLPKNTKELKCFIATAAFGSADAAPVQLLRDFRDEVLLQFSLGQKFVDWYYSWSPGAANWLMDHSILRIPVLIKLFELEVFAWMCLHPLLIIIFFGFTFGVGYGLREKLDER